MSNSRLQEISDIVDTMVSEKSQNYSDTIQLETVNEFNTNNCIVSKFTKLMLDTEMKLFNKYITGIKPHQMHLSSLYMILIYSLYKKGNNIDELKRLAGYNILYFENIDEYINNTYDDEDIKTLKKIMIDYDTSVTYDDYNGNIIKHHIDTSNLRFKQYKSYPIQKLKEYRLILSTFRDIIISNGKIITSYLETIKEDLISFKLYERDETVCVKDYKKIIISECMNKVNKLFKRVVSFNIPELEIYNKILEIKKEKLEIICVFHNVKLPISRNGNSLNNLSADILIILESGKLAIIEYDGPSHYSKGYIYYKRDNILCDILKNNFCKKNGIHILRVRNNDINYMNTIVEFINQITKTDSKHIINVPLYSEYIKLLA
jgi:hypothetical protein